MLVSVSQQKPSLAYTEYSDAVEEIGSPTLFRCWLSPSNFTTLASSNHETYPNFFGRSEDDLEDQSASRKSWMKPHYVPERRFYGNSSNLSSRNHLNIKPFVKNSLDKGLGQQEDTELEIVCTGEEVHSESGSNIHSGPLKSKGLQLIDLLPSSSSDSSISPTDYEPDSKLVAPSSVTEGTGPRIESVFSFSDYQYIPVELQQTMTHWMDNTSKQDDGFNGDSESDDPSIRENLSHNEPSTSPLTLFQISTQPSPSDRPQPMENPKRESHSHRCLICQKTYRSLSTLLLHMKYSKVHNPSFTQYLKKVIPFSCSRQGRAAGSQGRRSAPGLPKSPTRCTSSPKESLPVTIQPLSSTGIASLGIHPDHQAHSEILVRSGEAEDMGLPVGSVCPFNKSLTTPADFQYATTVWLKAVPMENEEELNRSLIDESDLTSYLENVPLEVRLWPMPTDPMAHGQTATRLYAEGASVPATPLPMGTPKYYSKAYWCSACRNFFRSFRTLQVHAKDCKPRKLGHCVCLSRNRPLPEKAACASSQPTAEQRGAAVGKKPSPAEEAPALCPARFIPMSKHFYLALANGHNYHVCNICDLWCHDERSLGFHLKVHFWRRNYCCCLCDRAFHTQKSCWRHQERHSSHPHYRCSTCSRTFSCYKSLKQHMGISHEINLELADNDTYEEAVIKAASYEMV
ncbi:uncharacterized protein [Heterodontus francisci]|uniref:uncharacterized protein isoform X2 n=1 Tax=Heterodontus francisci TaxID=7792 RepID=UPI00355C8095